MIRGGQRSERAYLQQVVQRVLPGLSEELLLDADEGGFPETLQTYHHPWTTVRVHSQNTEYRIEYSRTVNRGQIRQEHTVE